VVLAREVRDPLLQARALHALSQVCHDHDEAFRHLDEALRISERLGVPLWQARSLSSLGRLYAGHGDPGAARDAWARAYELFTAIGSYEAAETAVLLESRPPSPEPDRPLRRP
jgi:hypothetical protein